jgi:hypothetical protein
MMKQLNTKYGVIEKYLNLEMHDAETPASLLFTSRMEMETPCGTIVPQYDVEDHGRQQHRPVLFHSNGTLRRVPLQEPVMLDTSCGRFSGELLLFYKSGALKKFFPLAGKLSGYWSEKNEYELASEFTMNLPTGVISAKIINMGFYDSGTVRSVTFWPKETVFVEAGRGKIEARTGIAFYEDGTLKSLEPAAPALVETSIGVLKAFDNDPEGINGDLNSLQFDRAGNVSALTTISDCIIVTSASGEQKTYAPAEKVSLCSDTVKIAQPLLVEFIGGSVRFNKNPAAEYEIATSSFEIVEHKQETVIPSYDC